MLKQNLTNLISISFIGGMLGSALQYLLYLIVGRNLGSAALGLFTFGIVVLNVGTLFSKVGMDKAMRKFIPIYQENNQKNKLSGLLIFGLIIPFCMGIGLVIVLYLNSDLINSYLSVSFVSTTKLFLFGIPFMAIMTVGRAATTGFLRTRYAVYIKDFGQSGSAIVFVLIGSLIVGTTRAAVIGYTFSLVLSAMLALYYLYQLGGFNGFHKFEIDTKQILTYSLPLTAAAVSQYLTSWTDVLMLGTFTTESAVGRYQAAFQTAMILGFLLSAANSIFPSLASNLYDAGKTHELRDVYSILTKWITYLTVLGYTFVILYTSEILFLFGSEFVAAETVLIILAGVFVISTMVGPAGYLLMMADYEKVELINTLISGTLNIILNFILIQRFGILGAAIATGLSLVFQNLLRLSEIYWYFGIYPEIKNYWKGGIAIVVSVPVMIVCQYFISNYIVLLITSGMMGLITFALVTTLLGIDNKDKILVEKIS